MRNDEISTYWSTRNKPNSLFASEDLVGYNFQQSTLAFLEQAGLPAQVAPFLSFSQQASDFYRVQQQYKLPDAFARYIAIGSDGGGNPIVINTQQQDRIEWLDHEDDFTPQYVNASLSALVSCLVVYARFVYQVQEEGGEDAYLDAQFTDSHFASLRTSLLAEDPQAVEAEGFWKTELGTLLANREYYRMEENQ